MESVLLDRDSQSYTIQNLYTVNENQELCKDVETGYKNIVVDQVISEILFLKDEIIYLRGDTKKKNDFINYLLLQKTA